MKIEIGDKVRFLNDVGGGVVVGHMNQITVFVKQDDGFEFPVNIAECVVVTPQESKASDLTSKSEVAKSNVVTSSKSDQSNRVGLDALSVYLAFVPTNCNEFDSSRLQLRIVNNCSYSFYYTITNCSSAQQVRCQYSGVMRADEQIALGEIERTAFSDIENIRVQLLAFKHYVEYKQHTPIDKSLHIKAIRLIKRMNFDYSPIVGSEAMLFDLINDNKQKRENVIDVERLAQALNGGASTLKESVKSPKESETKAMPKVVEIDLHIDRLLDSTKGMGAAEMLEYQRDHIRSVIEKYKSYKGLKVIFIHGKGDGTLRATLEAELRAAGLSRRYRAASFKRFGSGAIEVNM